MNRGSKSHIELVESSRKRLQRRVNDVRELLIGRTSALWFPLISSERFDELRSFCCFVGHGRSGGTLVGALLNAHPNVVMSNELNALRRLQRGLGAMDLYRLICLRSRRQVARGSRGGGGYSYEVPGQWQGRYRSPTVIGDRKAGATAYEIVERPEILVTLDSKVELRKKFVHVIRNPFDTITTTLHKTRRKPGDSPDDHLAREISNYFARSNAITLIEQRFGAASVHHLYHERLVEEPVDQLRALCEFLDVEPLPDYLHACGRILRQSPNQSRRSFQWRPEQRAVVEDAMSACPWLSVYAGDY